VQAYKLNEYLNQVSNNTERDKHMKITVRELKSAIGQAVREARVAKARSVNRRLRREGAEHASIADAVEELIDMPGWENVENGDSLLATLKKIGARLHAQGSHD